MSADNPKTGPPDPFGFMAEFWSQWLEQTARGTQAILEATQVSTNPSALQQKTLEAFSDQIEQFMRTPAYMEMMRRNLKAMTDFKIAQDQVIHGAARQLGMPLADDIFGVFERLHSDIHMILKRLDQIQDRLSVIEKAVNPETNGTPHKPKSTRSKSRSRAE